jgi:hypothetical protein
MVGKEEAKDVLLRFYRRGIEAVEARVLRIIFDNK